MAKRGPMRKRHCPRFPLWVFFLDSVCCRTIYSLEEEPLKLWIRMGFGVLNVWLCLCPEVLGIACSNRNTIAYWVPLVLTSFIALSFPIMSPFPVLLLLAVPSFPLCPLACS